MAMKILVESNGRVNASVSYTIAHDIIHDRFFTKEPAIVGIYEIVHDYTIDNAGVEIYLHVGDTLIEQA